MFQNVSLDITYIRSRHLLSIISALVTDHLYLCGSLVFRHELLRQRGISCIINATAENPGILPAGVGKDIDYMHVRVEDSPECDLSEHFDRVAQKIERTRESGGRTLVHCGAGISRSPALCMAYLVKYENMSLRTAYFHVKACRPIIAPNIGFWKQLIEYERKLNGRTTIRLIPSGKLVATVLNGERSPRQSLHEPWKGIKLSLLGLCWTKKSDDGDDSNINESLEGQTLSEKAIMAIPAEEDMVPDVYQEVQEWRGGLKQRISTMHSRSGYPTEHSPRMAHSRGSNAVRELNRYSLACMVQDDLNVHGFAGAKGTRSQDPYYQHEPTLGSIFMSGGFHSSTSRNVRSNSGFAGTYKSTVHRHQRHKSTSVFDSFTSICDSLFPDI